MMNGFLARRVRAVLRASRLAAFAAAACACPGVAAAQDLLNNDYYTINRTPRGTELLASVEKYHLGLAEEELRRKRYEAAKGDIVFMLNSFPNHPQALLLMVDLCGRWKSPVCADDLPNRFNRAIAVNPRAPATFVIMGIWQQRRGAYPDAIGSYRQALALDPDSVNGHYNLGLAYFDAKQYDLANAHAQQAYRLGAQLPGLRDKLTRAGRWNPDAAPPPAASGEPAAPNADAKAPPEAGAAEPPK